MSTLPEGYVVKEKGQVVLLILLVMSVVLTVVLSIMARSVTDISITKYEDNSIRAFNAAEAGIEKAILGVPSTGTLDNGATYNSAVTSVAGMDLGSNQFGFAYPIDLNSGESATIWFVSHNDNGDITCTGGKPCMGSSQINVCWGKPGTAKDAYAPAILVEVFYENTGFVAPNAPWDNPTNNFSTIYVGRTTSDPYSSRGNGFVATPPSASTCVIGNNSYAFSQVVKFNFSGGVGMNLPNFNRPGGILFAKIHMLYNVDSGGNSIPQPLGVVATWSSGTFPAQGNLIQSTGSAGDSSRKLSVFQGYSELPYVFNSAIYSKSDIAK